MKRFLFGLFLISMIGMITGCGNRDQELDAYYNKMYSFTSQAKEIETDIENIDSTAEDSHTQLLEQLDKLDTLYSEMADYPVPDEFNAVKDLADEASSNMTEACSLYHMAFDGYEEYDEIVTDAALEYYQRAQKRIEYIGTLLKGEIPDDENVSYEEVEKETGSEFDDMDGGSDDSSEETEESEENE